MRFTLRFLDARAGTLLPALGLVVLTACNESNERPIPVPDLCGAQVLDLVGEWEITSPVPEPVSMLSSCSDSSLDGRPVGIRSDIYCESILPCPLVVAFDVPALHRQLDGTFAFSGTGSNGVDRLDGSVTLVTCGVSLTIVQTDNLAHVSCQGTLDASTRIISLICGTAQVERTPGDDLLVSCEVRPPIEGQITITPTVVLE